MTPFPPASRAWPLQVFHPRGGMKPAARRLGHRQAPDLRRCDLQSAAGTARASMGGSDSGHLSARPQLGLDGFSSRAMPAKGCGAPSIGPWLGRTALSTAATAATDRRPRMLLQPGDALGSVFGARAQRFDRPPHMLRQFDAAVAHGTTRALQFTRPGGGEPGGVQVFPMGFADARQVGVDLSQLLPERRRTRARPGLPPPGAGREPDEKQGRQGKDDQALLPKGSFTRKGRPEDSPREKMAAGVPFREAEAQLLFLSNSTERLRSRVADGDGRSPSGRRKRSPSPPPPTAISLAAADQHAEGRASPGRSGNADGPGLFVDEIVGGRGCGFGPCRRWRLRHRPGRSWRRAGGFSIFSRGPAILSPAAPAVAPGFLRRRK